MSDSLMNTIGYDLNELLEAMQGEMITPQLGERIYAACMLVLQKHGFASWSCTISYGDAMSSVHLRLQDKLNPENVVNINFSA